MSRKSQREGEWEWKRKSVNDKEEKKGRRQEIYRIEEGKETICGRKKNNKKDNM